MQMAWAGELEGWLTAPPRWHLVADASAATEWEPALRAGLDQPIEVIEPVPVAQLAASTARRAARANAASNLLPAEFSIRYHQQFIDRLWMRGLLAIAGLYVIGVVIFLIALQFALFRTQSVQEQAAGLSVNYTNAMQLEARYQVLKERQDLKYAALDSWKIVAELMPENLNLDAFNFSDGKRLNLNGTAPNESASVQQLLDFDKTMRRAPVFNAAESDNLNYRGVPPNPVTWNLNLVLKRTEVQ